MTRSTQESPVPEIGTPGSRWRGLETAYGEPTRARSWKRRIQPRGAFGALRQPSTLLKTAVFDPMPQQAAFELLRPPPPRDSADNPGPGHPVPRFRPLLGTPRTDQPSSGKFGRGAGDTRALHTPLPWVPHAERPANAHRWIRRVPGSGRDQRRHAHDDEHGLGRSCSRDGCCSERSFTVGLAVRDGAKRRDALGVLHHRHRAGQGHW